MYVRWYVAAEKKLKKKVQTCYASQKFTSFGRRSLNSLLIYVLRGANMSGRRNLLKVKQRFVEREADYVFLGGTRQSIFITYIVDNLYVL